MQQISVPDFMIVGAAKCGTTTLFGILGSHPQIFIPTNKEPWFFSHVDEDIEKIVLGPQKDMIVNDVNEYLKLYDGRGPSEVCGDASTSYLYDYEKTIENIKRLRASWENLKIIVVIRDPVERAYSHYLNNIRSGSEARDFSECIKCSVDGVEERYRDYLQYGMYHDQIRAYKEQFDNIAVILFEELVSCPEDILPSLFGFIGVDPTHKLKNFPKENASGVPTSQYVSKIIFQKNIFKTAAKTLVPARLRRMISGYIENKFMTRPDMTSGQREFLVAYYKDDILRLEKFLGISLASWKSFPELHDV